MKIIDLLNKIANGKEPKKIKYKNWLYDWNELAKDYECGSDWLEERICDDFKTFLNDEVEIADDEYKETKPLIKQDIEALGYACGEIQKYFTNGWKKSLENKSLNEEVEIMEEEKKIPEKLKDILRVNDLIPPVDENMYKIWTQIIKNHNKINEVLDYLKSKGE